MTPPTVSPLTDLLAALTAVDDAVGACLALAWATGLAPDDRRGAARRAVAAYEAADKRADLLLTAIIGAGGTRGLDDALGAAHRRAMERLIACYALRAGSDGPGGGRAVLVVEHAAERALARLARAQVVALQWIAQRREAA